MKIKILLFCLIFPLVLFSQNNRERINTLKSEIEDLKLELKQLNDTQNERIELNKENLGAQMNIINNKESNVSNQISVLSMTISIWGIILSFIALIVGIYFTWMQSKMKETLITSERILKDQEAIEDTVKTLQTSIDNNLEDLYLRLQDKELNYIFKRLENKPDEITYYTSKLSGFELDEKYFENLKNVFIALDKENKVTICWKLVMLLFVKFPRNLMTDRDMVDLFKKYSPLAFSNYTVSDYDFEEYLNYYITLSKNVEFDKNCEIIITLLKTVNSNRFHLPKILDIIFKDFNHKIILKLYNKLFLEQKKSKVFNQFQEEMKKINTTEKDLKSTIEKLKNNDK